MGDAKVRTMDVASPTETIATSRKSGWFQFTDLDKKALIRRINARYSSSTSINVKIYTDGDSSSAIFSDSFNPNVGSPLTTTSGLNSTTTSIPTNGTSFVEGDWIKIENEIMKVISIDNTTLTVQRGMRGTSAVSHNNSLSVTRANYPNSSLRVGKRAKYAMVEISTSAVNTDIEINKLEIEYDS